MIMSFEDIPEDREISIQCPLCDKGNVTETSKGIWECDSCNFIAEAKNDKGE